MLAAALSVAIGMPGCDKEVRDTDIKLISVGQVKSMWDRSERGDSTEMILLDPRPLKEYNAEHIKGARSLILPQVNPKGDRDPGVDKFKNIVVYGNDPGSATARGMTKRLIAVGYEHIRFFAGGMKEWKARGYPVEGKTPDAPAPSSPGEKDYRVVEPAPDPTIQQPFPPPPK
jgi:3-mercaptopyruvate sulfurtransferase SseA